MVHLNDPNVYEPLCTDISPTLKELITEKLKAWRNNGFLKQAWFEFCKPPKQTRTSRLYFLKKIHKNPMGIRPIVSSYNSITEPISQFANRWLQPHVKKPPFRSERLNGIPQPNPNPNPNPIETIKIPSNCLLASIDVSSLYTPTFRTVMANKVYYTIYKTIQTTTHDLNNQYQTF